MPNPPGTFEVIALGLSRALTPLKDDLHDPNHALMFLATLGLRLPVNSLSPALTSAFSTAHEAAHELQPLTDDLVTAIDGGDALDIIAKGVALAQQVAALINSFDTIASGINGLGAVPGVNSADLTAFVDALPRRLFETFVIEALEGYSRIPLALLEFVGLVERTRQNIGSSDPGRPEFVKKELRFDRLGMLLQSPDQLLESLYGWGQPGFDAQLLIRRVGDLLRAARVPVTHLQLPGPPPRPAIEVCIATIAPTVGLTPLGLELMLTDGIGEGITFDLPIAAGLLAHLAAEASLTARTGIRVQPPADITVIPPSGTVQGRLTAGIARVPQPPASTIVLLGIAGGTGLTAQRISANVVGGFQWDGSQARGDFGVQGEIGGGKLKIDMSEADGFLGNILSGIAVEADFNLGFGWSANQGVYFTGSSTLEIQLPTHISLGPVDLSALTLSVGIDGSRFPIGLATDIKAALGPLQGVVEQVGAAIELSFPAGGRGDIGPLDISFSFKPPKGVGLSVDAGVVKGGGYLAIDTDRGQYAGALQLVIADFLNVSAIGLIETKMPDGSKGFSLLIIITADFGPGIQLGFGFTLLAVGGLLGVNRSMLFQPIMDGVRTNAIASVMFPQDVIANAPRIISDLQAFFPPQQGTFLIGPMAKLGWGEPTLVSLSLGVIIEIPPGDIAILGILKLALPAEELAILVLQVNFAGAIEVDKQRIYFFASLFDSHILFITIDGGMGLLFAYGADANFVVSIGGFHPQFNPPPLPFPVPQRISVNIINEDYARIHCDGYFAVTTNTVQFGTHSDYFFGFSALSVEGTSGFDALIQFSPFHFSVSISTSFSVHVFGMGVFGVGIALTLEGPTPWHANGTASLSFLFFSVDIGIEFTWGDSRDTTLPPVAVMPILTGELGKQSNWRAIPPSGSNLLVSLRKLDPSEADLVLHPVGMLRISQRVVPLDLTLDKFGNQKPTDANRFTLSVTSAGFTKTRDLQEPFAPAQFKNMDDAGKLSQPAYAPQDSGIELAAGGTTYASATAITRIVRYDVTIIDTKLRFSFLKLFIFAGGLFQHLLRGASVARSPLSAYRKAQVKPYADAVTVSPETFAVALKSNNTAFRSDAAAFTSQAAANDYVARTVAGDPALAGTLHVLPQFEMAA